MPGATRGVCPRGVRPAVVWLLVVLFAGLAAAPAQAAVPARYVALGDSYSAGLGAGGTDSAGACRRSSASFPALWSSAHGPASFASAACAGATTSSVLSSQISSLSRDTTLVSITVGGNDVGFSAIMTSCALHGTTACVSAVDQAESQAVTALPGRLDATYQAISARAPGARVVVLGYPDFYQLHTWFCLGLSETARAKIDEGIDVVNSQLAAAAGRHGFPYADVRAAFVGHQLCSGSKWLHAVDLADLAESYHPTASGQARGYLPVFTAAAG